MRVGQDARGLLMAAGSQIKWSEVSRSSLDRVLTRPLKETAEPNRTAGPKCGALPRRPSEREPPTYSLIREANSPFARKTTAKC